MTNKYSVTDLCEFIWALESKYKLNKLDYKDVKIWQISRMKIFYKLSIEIELYGQAHSSYLNPIKQIKAVPLFLLNSIKNNPFFTTKKFNYLLIGHNRRTKKDDFYVDIYTEKLLENNSSNFMILEQDFEFKHYEKHYANTYYLDSLLLRVGFSTKFSRIISFNEEVKKIIENIEKDITDRFNIELSIMKILQNEYINFRIQYKYYYSLMIKKKFEKLYVVIGYLRMAAISAAKDLGIETIELQHGTISKYHLGYSYPNEKFIDYFPSKLYTFGSFWNKAACYPENISDDNFEVIGFPNISEYKAINLDDTDSVLFLSQGVIGKELLDLAFNYSKLNREKKIKFKFHPSEYSRWKKYFDTSICDEIIRNIEVIDYKSNLYELICSSNHIVGVFSTALYEALHFGKNVYVANLPGVEYMDDLIDMNIIKKFKDINELNNLINSNELRTSKLTFFE